ncbi:MAG: NAD(P)-dependent oxidoreductase [Pseudomonadota bacterium]
MKDKRTMNILITGSNGFLGKRIANELSKEHTIHCLDLGPKNEDANLQSYAGDLTSKQDTARLISELQNSRIDCVIHLASKLCSLENSSEWGLLDDNLSMTKNMVEIALRLKPQVFINASSVAVYPNRDGEHSENSAVDMCSNSDCLYGLSKFNAEVLFNYFLKDKMKVINLRIAQVFGPGMRKDRIIPTLIKELKEKNKAAVYGSGERIVNHIHADDVAAAIQAIIENPKAGTFNLVNEHNLTTYELAQNIIQNYGNEGSQIERIEKGSRAKPVISSEKIRKAFNIRCSNLDFSNIDCKRDQ